MKLYFAYGSNMCRKQMKKHRLDQRRFGNGILKGFRWIISARGYANIVKSKGDEVHGVVYKISEADEQILDNYYDVPNGSYQKKMTNIKIDKTIYTCLVYIDPNEAEGNPKEEYIDLINKGISDAELHQKYVETYIRKFISNQ